MRTLVRAVITGFGLALGKLIFEKVQEKYVDFRGTRSADMVDADLVDSDDFDADGESDSDSDGVPAY